MSLKIVNDFHLNEDHIYHGELSNHLLEEATELTGLPLEGFEVGYSLSNSQGDGVCFTKGSLELKDVLSLLKKDKRLYKGMLTQFDNGAYSFIIKQSGRYQHSHSFSIESDYAYYEVEYSSYGGKDYTQAVEQLENDLLEYLRGICDKLENLGYTYIENLEQEAVASQVFKAFLEFNDIESDLHIWELDYSFTPKEGYTQISELPEYTCGDIYVLLPELVENTREDKFYTFK